MGYSLRNENSALGWLEVFKDAKPEKKEEKKVQWAGWLPLIEKEKENEEKGFNFKKLIIPVGIVGVGILGSVLLMNLAFKK